MESTEFSKFDKKIRKKQLKSAHLMEKHEGIKTSDTPTRFILLSNFGVVTGASRELVEKAFSEYGKLESVVLIADKSYSFVAYSDVSEAETAVKNLQGVELVYDNVQSKIYLSYVERVPDTNNRISATLPEGLLLLPDYVTESEAALLLSVCFQDDVEGYSEKQVLKHRKVKHYGFEFCYDTNNVDANKPLDEDVPKECHSLINRLLEDGSISSFPDQLTVNRYEPGQGIPPHVDTHSAFEDEIVSLSLGAAIVMDFRHPDGRHVPVLLPSRSALVMKGESRFLWSHGITPRKSDVVPASKGGVTVIPRRVRTSFTFRRVRGKPCCCGFPSECDSQSRKEEKQETPQLNPTELENLETKHVQQVYESIADHFSLTRHKPWPKVMEFVKGLSAGSILIDVGCGNGKYFGLNPDIVEVGCDQSVNLMKISHSRGYEVFVSDILTTPVRNDFADACICIAVVHHMSTEERRKKALSELVRILRPGGKALVYVWAMEQEVEKSGYIKDSRARVVQENSFIRKEEKKEDCNEICSLQRNRLPELRPDLPPLPIHVNRTHFQHQDILVPWHLKKREVSESEPTYYRYYHVFQSGELESLCDSLDVEVVNSYYDKGNWCVLMQKT